MSWRSSAERRGQDHDLAHRSGLIKPVSGRVLLDGEDVTGHEALRHGPTRSLPSARRARIFPSLTVKENIVLNSPKGKEKESLVKAGEQFPVLAERLGEQAGSLSGGAADAVPRPGPPDKSKGRRGGRGVTRAVAAPGGPGVRRARQIVAGGTALLLVEQYVTRALELADTAYIMNRGQIVHSGAAADLQGEEVFERYLGIEVGS